MPDPHHWYPSSFPPPDSALTSEALPAALSRAVERWPQHPASLFGESCLSLEQLSQRVAGLADQIRRSSAPPGPIALVQSPGVDAVAAWFACGMARRPFLLLEPSHPPARLKELITAAAATLILCDPGTRATLPRDLPTEVIEPDGRLLPWHVDDALGVDEPAMIFPTSGSTGAPKLVTYSSRTLQIKVQSSRSLMKVDSGQRVLIAGSHGNFGFLHHALVFLLSGGTLCLTDLRADGLSGILQAIMKLEVKHVRFTPSLFRTIARQPEARSVLQNLEAVRFSGEPLLKSDLELAQALLAPDCLIQNVYGSTESTLFIWSLGDALDPTAGTVPIGHVYPYSAYALRPLEDAGGDTETGELLLRSAYHALGDLKDGMIDPARFPADPGSGPERDYATGDIVRRLPGGGLVMLGRSNRMVKIRGQRVFLTEVENHLRAIPGVTGAAATDREEEDGTTIFGFITLAEGSEPPVDTRNWLANRLPAFMVPRLIVVIDHVPMLPGGKIDYQALLDRLPTISDTTRSETLPEGDYRRLAGIWQATLGWGAHDPANDFFALGGDSLKLMQLSLAIEREFGRTLPAEAFSADPSLMGLAKILGIASPESAPSPASGLRLRPFCNARLPSRGIALGMPGWHGSANVAPFREADFFADHDIWSADVPLPGGNLLEGCRWWHAALEIAGRLREAEPPTPRILFGYSIAGSIAWLVGRLLAGTPQCPAFIVMVDAVPMHRLPRYRNLDIRILAARTSTAALPPALHIQRASLEQQGLRNGSTRLWLPEDNIIGTMDLPTVDHLDMGQPEVLKEAQAWVTRSLAAGHCHASASEADAQISTLGGRIYRLLACGDARGTPELIDMFEEAPEHIRLGHFAPMLHLALRDGSREQAQTLLQDALTQNPGSRLLHYAWRRLQRQPESLVLSRAPLDEIWSIGGIEKAMSTHASAPRGPASIRRLLQAIDMAGAVVDATPARLRSMIRRRLNA